MAFARRCGAQPNERLNINLMAEHIEDDGASRELWLPRKDHLVDPSDIRLTTVTLDDPFLLTRDDVISVDLTYDFDRATLRSISAYAQNDTRSQDDCAGLPQLRGCVRGVRPATYEQWSQEIHLGSPVSASWDWLIGLFFLDAQASTNFHFSAPLLAPGPINDYSATSKERAYAGFGQASRSLNQRWSITGGLRLSHEAHRVSELGTGIADQRVPTAAGGSWDSASWRIGMQYAPADDVLVYASVATGFKSGGVTTELLPTGEFDSFDPEDLTAYEAGINLRLPNRRWWLLASAFFYDFRDLQIRTTAVLANRVVSVVDNAAAARIRGIDLSATMDVSDRLALSGALVWMPKREFVEFTNVATGDTLSGNTLSRAPERTASVSLSYLLPLRRIGDLSARVDYNYRSEFFFTHDNDPATAQDGFGLLNLFLRLVSPDESWYLFASARNLLDTDYFNQVFIQSSPGYPENYEIGFGLRF